jgi:hypothetical protein
MLLLSSYKSNAAVSKSADMKGIVRSEKKSNLLSILSIGYAANNGKAAGEVQFAMSKEYPLLRLKLILDPYDYDDIAIGFNALASLPYNNQLDSRYLPGINAAVGLASLSSDNVPLSVNMVPLPGKNTLTIKLDVDAQTSGVYSLQQTELDSISQVYQIMLVDKYKKDSIDLRTVTNYSFSIDKKDTLSFGTSRFEVVIRKNPAQLPHLVTFTATKASNSTSVTWITTNEQNNTNFIVERSIDAGATYFDFPAITSSSTGTYTFLDKNPVDGIDLYRLKMTDADSSVTYSEIVTLSFGSTTADNTPPPSNINIYPNPSNGIINLAINSNGISSTSGNLSSNSIQNPIALQNGVATTYDIKILNIKGTVIKSATSSSGNWQANMPGLSPGTYIIQVVNNSDKSIVGKSTFIKL